MSKGKPVTPKHMNCVFPFRHKGRVHNSCTGFSREEPFGWCGTQESVEERHGSDGEPVQGWGPCGAWCSSANWNGHAWDTKRCKAAMRDLDISKAEKKNVKSCAGGLKGNPVSMDDCVKAAKPNNLEQAFLELMKKERVVPSAGSTTSACPGWDNVRVSSDGSMGLLEGEEEGLSLIQGSTEPPLDAGTGKRPELLAGKMEKVLSRYNLHCREKKNRYSIKCDYWRRRFVEFARFVEPICKKDTGRSGFKQGCKQIQELQVRFRRLETILVGTSPQCDLAEQRIPSPPEEVQIGDVTPFLVNIKWSPSPCWGEATSATAKGSQKVYQLQASHDAGETWSTVYMGPARVFKHKGLEGESEYGYRVIASSEQGASPPSWPAYAKTSKAPAPRIAITRPKKGVSMQAGWSPPKSSAGHQRWDREFVITNNGDAVLDIIRMEVQQEVYEDETVQDPTWITCVKCPKKVKVQPGKAVTATVSLSSRGLRGGKHAAFFVVHHNAGTETEETTGDSTYIQLKLAITGKPGTPLNPTLVKRKGHYALLRWPAPVVRGAADTTRYTLEFIRRVAGDRPKRMQVKAGQGGGSRFKLGGLRPNMRYRTRLRATNPVGTSGYGPWTDIPCACPNCLCPGVPHPPLLRVDSVHRTSMRVAWSLAADSPRASSYSLQYSIDGGEIWTDTKQSLSENSHTVSKLPACKLIFWRIFARNGKGPGGVSATVKASTFSDGRGVVIAGRLSGGFSHYADVSMGDAKGDRVLHTARVRSGDRFSFKQVPAGKYFLKVEKRNWKFPRTKSIIVYKDQARHSCLKQAFNFRGEDTSKGNKAVWHYAWKGDRSRAGEVTEVNVVKPPVILPLKQPQNHAAIKRSVETFANKLADEFEIYLINNVRHPRKLRWNNEHAYRLHQSLHKFPLELFVGGPFYMILINGFVKDDYQLVEREFGKDLPEEGVCHIVQQSDGECKACEDHKERVRIHGAPARLSGLYTENGSVNNHTAYTNGQVWLTRAKDGKWRLQPNAYKGTTKKAFAVTNSHQEAKTPAVSAWKIWEDDRWRPTLFSSWIACTEGKCTKECTPVVMVSSDVFTYATPKLVQFNGKRGVFYSKRMHHFIAKWRTDMGRRADVVQSILVARYGVSINVPNFKRLTQLTTSENRCQFQPFLPQELVYILATFEESPPNVRKLDSLKYLIRRLSGHPHPLYGPSVAAVAWMVKDAGYIEFMEKAFSHQDGLGISMLVMHEKAHMIDFDKFTPAMRTAWHSLSGWRMSKPNGVGVGKWLHSTTTNFVSRYSTGNPSDDLADSIAAFTFKPKLLQSVARDKYNFIRDGKTDSRLFQR